MTFTLTTYVDGDVETSEHYANMHAATMALMGYANEVDMDVTSDDSDDDSAVGDLFDVDDDGVRTAIGYWSIMRDTDGTVWR